MYVLVVARADSRVRSTDGLSRETEFERELPASKSRPLGPVRTTVLCTASAEAATRSASTWQLISV